MQPMNDENSILQPSDIQRVVRRYQERVAEFGTTLSSLNSGSSEKQRLRHEVHARAIYGDRPSILDIGCGIGTFYEYLNGTKRSCRYTGYDIVPEYVEFCRQHFTDCRFELRNIFSEGISGTFDTIVLSQVLNNRYRESNNLEVMQAAVKMAFARSNTAVSVDMLSSYVDFESPDLFYYSPEVMFAFAKSLTRRVILRHDYRPFEFCLQLFHDDAPGYIA